MKKIRTAICLSALSAIATSLVSCFDGVENEYRVTVPTFATVTHDEAGHVRLYLDEGRGILEPGPKSADINWGDAVRVMIKYDLPIIGSETTSMESVRFKGIVRNAVKLDTVALVNATGMDKAQVDALDKDTVLAFNFHAYWGYITMQAWTANNFNFDMTCSYDTTGFDGENLYLKMHYAEKKGTWNYDFLQTATARLPEFLTQKGVVTSDSLNIIMTAPVWYNANRDSVYTDTVKFKISRGRLAAPTYNYTTGGY